MPSDRKSDKVPDKVQDLAPRNTGAGEADKIRGGGGILLPNQPLLEKPPSLMDSLSDMSKQTSQATRTILDNTKG